MTNNSFCISVSHAKFETYNKKLFAALWSSNLTEYCMFLFAKSRNIENMSPMGVKSILATGG